MLGFGIRSQSRMISKCPPRFFWDHTGHDISNCGETHIQTGKNWPKRCQPAVAAAWSKQTESLNNLSVLQLLFGQTAQPQTRGEYTADRSCAISLQIFSAVVHRFLFFVSAWLNPSQPNTCCNKWMPFKVLTGEYVRHVDMMLMMDHLIITYL